MSELLQMLFFAAWNGLAMFGLCHAIYYLRPHWFESHNAASGEGK